MKIHHITITWNEGAMKYIEYIAISFTIVSVINHYLMNYQFL